MCEPDLALLVMEPTVTYICVFVFIWWHVTHSPEPVNCKMTSQSVFFANTECAQSVIYRSG